VNLRQRTLLTTDRVLATSLVVLVLGSSLCFGGAVWWYRPAAAFLAFLLAGTMLVRLMVTGRSAFLKSPLTLLGLLVLALGILQLVPLPPRLARRISPVSQQIYSYGVWLERVRSDDSTAVVGEPAQVRSPSSLDRSATLRWLVGATGCLGTFWVVSHFTDRLRRLYLVWGSVVAAFLLNGALGLVQVAGQSDGLFGSFLPGRAPSWTPSLDNLLEAPTTTSLRRVGDSTTRTNADTNMTLERIALVPNRPFWFGTMVGGSGAFLALGSLALPLSLAIVLHLISPRGSRESFFARLAYTGQGSLVVLLIVMLVVCAFLVGLMAGPWYSLPFGVGLLVVGLPSLAARGSRGSAIGLTILLLVSLAMGATLVATWARIVGGQPPVAPLSWEATRLLWTESLPLLKEFPVAGTGFGSFPTIHPYFKMHEASSTTAMSSLLQCAVESGVIGLGILGLAGLWSVCRLPFCLKRVGSADRTLAYGLLGATLGFSLWFVVYWTIELPAVAISVSALGGTWNRWLAGGTDLFVERG
jgi:hypothetical protein